MPETCVGILRAPDELARFFTEADLQRLAAACNLLILDPQAADLLQTRAACEILISSWGMPRLDEEFLASMPKLRAVCYAAGSVKKFVTEASYARGIVITTAMHANAIPVAEVTVALMTLAAKDWFSCHDLLRSGGAAAWSEARHRPHLGFYDLDIGLIGCGTIAREVIRRLRDSSHRLWVYDPYLSDAAAGQLGVGRIDSLPELARRCQICSLHAPNIPETRHMLSTDFFRALPDGGIFINTARGALVDEAALLAELQTGRISAHLDVIDSEPPAAGHPLYHLPNCHMSPHRAGSSAAETRRLGRYAIDDCLRLLAGEAPRYPVSQEMLATMA